MIPQGRYIIFFLALLLVAHFSKRTYLYYFDTTQPQVTIIGFENGKAYAGEVVGSLKGWSPYKISHISMWLDDNLMHRDFKINRKQFDHSISIPVTTIPDGLHSLKFEIVDGTKHQNKTCIERSFYTDNVDLQAVLVPSSSDYKVPQGRCLRIQIQVNKPIRAAVAKVLIGEYSFFPESKNSLIYETYVPIECEQDAGEFPFSVEVIDRLGNKVVLENKFQVTSVMFKKRTLNVPENRLQSELEFTNKQEQDLEAELERLAAQSAPEKLWNGPFDVPIVMTGIVTEFGAIRTSPERGKRVHKALDLIALLKSVIWASHNGVIVIKDRFNHSGNTVVIDHGCGVLSLYYHLNDFADIAVGQRVKKGHPLGRMGMTGYANGHHLHWEMRVNNVAVEPMQWTQRWL